MRKKTIIHDAQADAQRLISQGQITDCMLDSYLVACEGRVKKNQADGCQALFHLISLYNEISADFNLCITDIEKERKAFEDKKKCYTEKLATAENGLNAFFLGQQLPAGMNLKSMKHQVDASRRSLESLQPEFGKLDKFEKRMKKLQCRKRSKLVTVLKRVSRQLDNINHSFRQTEASFTSIFSIYDAAFRRYLNSTTDNGAAVKTESAFQLLIDRKNKLKDICQKGNICEDELDQIRVLNQKNGIDFTL